MKPPVQLEWVKRRAYEVYRSAAALNVDNPLSAILLYVNDLFKDYVYPVNYGSVNPNYTVDKVKEGDIIDTAVEVAEAISGGDMMESQTGPLAY